MKKFEFNKKIMSLLLEKNQDLFLYIAYLNFYDTTFKLGDVVDLIKKVTEENFPLYEFKTDFSNELASNIENTSAKSYQNKFNKKWYLDNDVEGSKIKLKTITDKGKMDIEKLVDNLSSKIIDYLGSEKISVRAEKATEEILIKDLVNKIKSGQDARIPTFQREYVWNSDKVAPLLLSLIKDYPIGSMLFWDKDDDENYLILDGLQRTFSLTLISNHPYAYVNYELYEHIVKVEMGQSETSIKKNDFENKNKDWMTYFEDVNVSVSNKTKEKMLTYFNMNYEFCWFIDFVEKKWKLVFEKYKIPYILLNSNYKKDETTDIFNLINTQGVELNNFETNASIWSKTLIEIQDPLPANHFMSLWKDAKYKEYNSKLGLENSVVKLEEANLIEPSDFIYSIFDEASKNKIIIRDSFFKNDKLKENALEPLLTIFINQLNMKNEEGNIYKDYKKALPLIGKKLHDNITLIEDIEILKNSISESLSIVENKLTLLKNIITNKNDSSTITISASLLSLIINVTIKHKNEVIINKLLYIFIVEYFTGSYGSGSTANAWKVLNKEEYKAFGKNEANNVICKFIIEKHESNKIDSNYNSKFILILSLFLAKFIPGLKDKPLEVDHIIPRSLFNYTESNKKFTKNYLNSFYNLQLLDNSINSEKSNKIEPENESYYLMYEMKNLEGSTDYITKQKENLSLIKSDLCTETKSGKCRKVTNPKYENFEKFIEQQVEFISPLINKGLLD